MPDNDDQPRLLFVEDEEGIRLTLATVLERRGFNVTTAASVGDALTQINCLRYDVLLCDLNIEKPGDGFAVIGAMRYAQPHCISLVLTAYPSFENAMQAIQHQVDEFFTKPADVETLVKSIQQKLDGRRAKLPAPFKSLSLILRENCGEIVAGIRAAIQDDPILSTAPLSRGRESRGNNLSKIMDALIEYMEVGRNGLKSEALKLGAEHGRRRRKQGYDLLMVVREFQFINQKVCELMASDRMPAAPVGLTTDLMKFTKGLNSLMIEALKPYVGTRQASHV
jgi:ActR/RegA family two-component response regulator